MNAGRTCPNLAFPSVVRIGKSRRIVQARGTPRTIRDWTIRARKILEPDVVRSTLLLALLSLVTGCCVIDPCTGGVHCRTHIFGCTSFGLKGCDRCSRRACDTNCCPTGCRPAGWGAAGYGDPSLVAPSYGPPAATIPGTPYTTTPTSPAPMTTPSYTLPAVDATPPGGGVSPLVPPPQALPTGVAPAPGPALQGPAAHAPGVIRNTYSWGRGPQRS